MKLEVTFNAKLNDDELDALATTEGIFNEIIDNDCENLFIDKLIDLATSPSGSDNELIEKLRKGTITLDDITEILVLMQDYL
jgi:hypothetical protein